MGRRRGHQRAKGARRAIGPHDLYGGASRKEASDAAPSPGSEMERLRAQARELIRRHPGDKKVLMKAADLMVRAARTERYISGGRKEVDRAATAEFFGQLSDQLMPRREEPEE